MTATTTETNVLREIHAGQMEIRREIEQILRLRLMMREESIRDGLKYLKSGDYEMARITLETFATPEPV